MKRVYLLPILLLSVLNLQSQARIGAKAGFNLSTIVGDDAESWESRSGFLVGAALHLELNSKWALQPEIFYAQQGADYTNLFSEGEEFEPNKGTIKLDYFNMPVMAQYKLTDSFVVEAGPQLGFLLSADNELKSEDEEFNVRDFFKGVDIAMNAGLGYHFKNGLFINARYSIGLIDLNYDDSFNDDGVIWNNSVFQFSLGYFIDMTPKVGGEPDKKKD